MTDNTNKARRRRLMTARPFSEEFGEKPQHKTSQLPSLIIRDGSFEAIYISCLFAAFMNHMNIAQKNSKTLFGFFCSTAPSGQNIVSSSSMRKYDVCGRLSSIEKLQSLWNRPGFGDVLESYQYKSEWNPALLDQGLCDLIHASNETLAHTLHARTMNRTSRLVAYLNLPDRKQSNITRETNNTPLQIRCLTPIFVGDTFSAIAQERILQRATSKSTWPNLNTGKRQLSIAKEAYKLHKKGDDIRSVWDTVAKQLAEIIAPNSTEPASTLFTKILTNAGINEDTPKLPDDPILSRVYLMKRFEPLT